MKTGNCWENRHHTCKGWGLTSQKIEGKKQIGDIKPKIEEGEK